MKISELLNKKALSISFEVFPPKTETGFESVRSATEEIAKLHPAFMSVTYGAGGGTSRYTLDIAKNIKQLYGVPTLAHLTCVSSTKDTLFTGVLLLFLVFLTELNFAKNKFFESITKVLLSQ